MTTWIFLRGLTRETAHWGVFPDVFQRAVLNARVVSLDLPGNGQLHALPSPLSIASMVDYCRAELIRRSEKPPYHLLAMSMGAMVATQWSYQTPGEITACVLINTSFRPFNSIYQRLRPRNYGALLRLVLPPANVEKVERTILRLTSNCVSRHQAILPVWIAARAQRRVTGANALRQLIAAARFQARSEPPATDLLLLGSAQDQLVNVECTLAIARHWRCPVTLHPSAGHDLPLDDPMWVVEQVRCWLASRPDSAMVANPSPT